MNLVKLLFNAASKASDSVLELLTVAMQKAVKDVIEEEICGYRSEFKKKFKTELEKSFAAGFDGMVLTDYTAHIIDAVKTKHSEVLKGIDLSGIEDTIKGVIAPLKPEYKLSELVEIFKGGVDSYDKEDVDECFFECEQDSEKEWWTIKLGIEDHNNSENVEFLVNKSGSMFILKTNTTWDKYKQGSPATVAHFSDFQMLLLKIKNSQSTIIIDEDYVDVSYNTEEY